MGNTLKERGSVHYRFEQFDLDSIDGARHYRVYLALPKQASNTPHPVMYMLDGNAALNALQDEWFSELPELPVLVMIGYRTDKLFDVTSRVYDYTIKPANTENLQDEQGRAAGGADHFQQLIAQQIKPDVEKRIKVDASRQTLWGHSFGGLFTLYTFFTDSSAFTRYVAVSPSLWWQKGLILTMEQNLNLKQSTQLVIMRGSDEAKPRTAANDAKTQARSQARAAVPARALPEMVTRLKQQTVLQIDFEELSGLGHGPMLAASLPKAIAVAAAP